jgi:hypothetical protein
MKEWLEHVAGADNDVVSVGGRLTRLSAFVGDVGHGLRTRRELITVTLRRAVTKRGELAARDSAEVGTCSSSWTSCRQRGLRCAIRCKGSTYLGASARSQPFSDAVSSERPLAKRTKRLEKPSRWSGFSVLSAHRTRRSG